jgi:hypothetical protein
MHFTCNEKQKQDLIIFITALRQVCIQKKKKEKKEGIINNEMRQVS